MVQLADVKANSLLTIHALIISLFAGALFITGTESGILQPKRSWQWISTVLFILGATFLLISAFLSIIVIMPQLAKHVGVEDKSMFYFEHISTFTDQNEFYSKFESSTAEEINKDIAHQAYVVSKIVVKKFRRVRWSLFFMIGYLVTFVFGLIFIFLQSR